MLKATDFLLKRTNRRLRYYPFCTNTRCAKYLLLTI